MTIHTLEVSIPSVGEGRLIQVSYKVQWQSATHLWADVLDCFFSEDDTAFEPSAAELEKLTEFVAQHHEEDHG